MRQAARRDSNEGEIVRALEAVGCSVTRLSQKGVPDLLTSRNGVNYLLEVKEGKAKLTEDQEAFFAYWQGQVCVVRSVEDALRAVGAIE